MQRTKPNSKRRQITVWLLCNRSWAITPATPTQQLNFAAAQQLKYSPLPVGAKLLGMVGGHTVMQTPNGRYYTCRILKGGYHSYAYGSPTLRRAKYGILYRMAWGAATRTVNVGAWQLLQLPLHLRPMVNQPQPAYTHPYWATVNASPAPTLT